MRSIVTVTFAVISGLLTVIIAVGLGWGVPAGALLLVITAASLIGGKTQLPGGHFPLIHRVDNPRSYWLSVAYYSAVGTLCLILGLLASTPAA